jgi:hypothetical protein
MTAQESYYKAVGLLDELETDGTISSDTNEAYQYRAIALIDTLQRQIAVAESVEPNEITALTDTLKISDSSASRVLPYGIAANFALSDRMMDMYAVFDNAYRSELSKVKAYAEDYIDDMSAMSGF